MYIDQEKLTEINKVQIEILKEVVQACEKLNLKYYMVHGSLLGTVMTGKFMPFDDDIDIAMPRKDYERFVEEAQDLLPSHYFVQTNKSDKNYPLEFGKVRDSNTTYIVEMVKKLKMNHGIYIDIFPIDYCEERKIKAKWNAFLLKLFSIRIACRFEYKTISKKAKIRQWITCILFPSWGKTIEQREGLLKKVSYGHKIRLTGGKTKERGIPAEWFSNAIMMPFEGIDIKVPEMYKEYLTAIYGDYKNHFLAEGKMQGNEYVEINACVVDVNQSYKNYT